MENQRSSLEVLFELIEAYAKTSLKLYRYKATDKVAELVSDMASGLTMVVILILVFVNLNIGIALFLGDLFGKIYLGFLAVSGLYGCFGLLIYFFRAAWIKKPVNNLIINNLLKNDNNIEEEIK
ncbi:MAG: hypothetical protein WCP85_13360 [Mariniphaga sp.]